MISKQRLEFVEVFRSRLASIGHDLCKKSENETGHHDSDFLELFSVKRYEHR